MNKILLKSWIIHTDFKSRNRFLVFELLQKDSEQYAGLHKLGTRPAQYLGIALNMRCVMPLCEPIIF